MALTVESLTPAWIRETYLHGIPLKNQDAEDMPDASIKFFIASAIRELESELDLYITPRYRIDERYDFHLDVWREWAFIQLHHRPVIAVQSMDIRFGTQTVFSIPVSDWVRVDKPADKYGQVQLFPSLGTFASVPALDSAYVLAPMLMSARYAPQVQRVEYDAGMLEIEEDMADAIGMRASIKVLNVLGDILLGAGIASLSIGLDGFSQSIGTTQSAENAAYSARIRMYNGELYGHQQGTPGLLDNLKAKWRRPIAVVI